MFTYVHMCSLQLRSLEGENILQEVPEEILNRTHGEVRLQSGTNKYASQRGMTGFGTGRDVCREGVHVMQLPADLEVFYTKSWGPKIHPPQISP